MQIPNFSEAKNLLNKFNSMKQNVNVNILPQNIDKSTKRMMINKNISECRAGVFKTIPKYESLSCDFCPVELGKATSICNVSVVYEHGLDVAQNYAEIGIRNFTQNNKLNPVILNVIGNEFSGSNFESSEDFRDDLMNLRTSFCSKEMKQSIFPIKDICCVHTPFVTVIRPKNPHIFNTAEQCYRIGFISATPIQQTGLVKNFTSTDYLNTLAIIENVFQIAIGYDHQVLILVPFGHEEDNNPIGDIIKIYNQCILKYGHKFKSIIIAIPPHYPKPVYNVYSSEILKPNEIVQKVDNKYNGLMIQQKIQEKMVDSNESDSVKKPKKKKKTQELVKN